MVKLTAKQYLKLHPEKYVMVTHEFNAPVYVAPCKDNKLQVCDNLQGAEIWSALDTTANRLSYHAAATGYKELIFEMLAQ